MQYSASDKTCPPPRAIRAQITQYRHSTNPEEGLSEQLQAAGQPMAWYLGLTKHTCVSPLDAQIAGDLNATRQRFEIIVISVAISTLVSTDLLRVLSATLILSKFTRFGRKISAANRLISAKIS